MANLLSTREDQGKYFALYGASVSLQHRIGNDAAALRALRNVEDKMNKEGNPACIAVLQWWKAILGEERFEEYIFNHILYFFLHFLFSSFSSFFLSSFFLFFFLLIYSL